MGVSQSKGIHNMLPEELKKAFTFPGGILLAQTGHYRPTALCRFSILSRSDPDIAHVRNLKQNQFAEADARENRAIGCFLGCAIGDAIGAPLEFSDVRYGSEEKIGFDHPEIWRKQSYNRFQLKPGQWTDDCSMALCIADTLLTQRNMDLCDLRLRFHNWWTLGYNNAFGSDGEGRSSVGLGGNISESFVEFVRSKGACGGETRAGDKFTSGNGSLMRLAPVPIFFAKTNTVEECMEGAAASSKTTHQGEEAAECCRLMAFVIHSLINRDEATTPNPKSVLDALSQGAFSTRLYSVRCLAQSEQEERCEDNKQLDLRDRNWNWKNENFRYAPSRARSQPGYVGSYCMDALAMALHCCYHTSSFGDAVIKAANVRGDSDTVADIAGQIAGAMYGASTIPTSWIDAIGRWDNNGDIMVKAYKLFHHHFVTPNYEEMAPSPLPVENNNNNSNHHQAAAAVANASSSSASSASSHSPMSASTTSVSASPISPMSSHQTPQ